MAETIGRRRELVRTILSFLLAAFYYLGGMRHLMVPNDFAAMIPWVPHPQPWRYSRAGMNCSGRPA
jgi:uncharacterized membrane protein